MNISKLLILDNKQLKVYLNKLIGGYISSKDAEFVNNELLKKTGKVYPFSTCGSEIRARIIELYRLIDDNNTINKP